MQIKTVLKQLGLNDRHATIYLACLELGSASIQKISAKSGFARSTCEAVLQSLQKKGYITTFKKKNTRYFSPEDPKKLIGEAKDKVSLLEKSLPEFSALYFKGGEAPSARVYEGEKAVNLVFMEILDEAKELLAFGSVDELTAVFPNYFTEFTKNRIERTIPLKLILRNTPLAQERQELGPQELREVRITPDEERPYAGLVYIWGNKIAMVSLKKEITAFVIESEDLSHIQKAMFFRIWDTLPPGR
ncbi:MAG: hypothetical protein COV91_01125 [Candidatus Taylorbacteria bacterium CG11_big_fil_rev_8_21_14_0_20_46_11]|uniref:YTH domain-containing protein n=1 Tax=Candidatus Taylorbacteria bacterium CG11_big_fil_rev_8_21_14_0_20_46_11 TaxID=1975025 RepID=A0A2H0KCK7_9BACT|nr:MAG: hypothetical protein COV91_01125 [Candidatus Taylorbacteria bacterium CG11_big_fil_rev_8_21_14_0_20_46_11]